jgi:hypothetical protein
MIGFRQGLKTGIAEIKESTDTIVQSICVRAWCDAGGVDVPGSRGIKPGLS